MDRTQGARELRMLRESRGWSWSDLARALGQAARDLSMAEYQLPSLQRNIARWESGRGCPNDRHQLLLAQIYRADLPVLISALACLGVPEERLFELVAHVEHPSVELSSGALDVAVRRINARVGSAPFVRLQLELAPIVERVRQLMRSPSPDLLPHHDRDVLTGSAVRLRNP